MQEMAANDFRNILIVDMYNTLYVVEAPTHEANVGDLVEFEDQGSIKLGRVVDKCFCVRNDDEYRCWSLMHTIHPAKQIYKASQEILFQSDLEV